MVWATWRGDNCWERLFDFGNNVVTGGHLEAETSLFMTPHVCATDPLPAVRLEFRTSLDPTGTPYVRFTAAGRDVLSAPEAHQYVATLDATATMTLYVDGAKADTSSLTDDASGTTYSVRDVRDIDNWLGRSQYLADAFFVGDFDEFRIYGVPLTADQVQAAFDAGPDTVPDVE
jgi:hypothetical protein